MKAHFSNKPGEKESSSVRVTHKKDRLEPPSTTETIHEVAEVSRALRNATAVLENFVHTASGKSDLTLSHWLVMVSVLNKPTCKQVDVKSATSISPAYLSRLLDELVD
jgi:hypothetical protein